MCCGGGGKGSNGGGNEDDGIELSPRPLPPSPPRSSEELGAPIPVGDQTDGIISITHPKRGRPISRIIDPTELSSGISRAQRNPNRRSAIFLREQTEQITPAQAILEYVNEAPLDDDEPVDATSAAAPASSSTGGRVCYKDEPEAPIPVATAAAQATLYSRRALRANETAARVPNSTGPLERPFYISRRIQRTPGPASTAGRLREPPPIPPPAPRPLPLHSNEPVCTTESPQPASTSNGALKRPLNVRSPTCRTIPGRQRAPVPPTTPLAAPLLTNEPVRPIESPVPPTTPRAAPLQTNDPVRTTESPAPGSITIDPLEGHSNVGRPMVREHRSNLSEILNLSRAVRANGHIRSPSGNILSADQFIARTDRPKLMEERQEAIMRKVAEANRKEQEKEAEEVMEKVKPMDLKKEKKKEKGKRACWGWGCFGKSDEEE